MKHTRLILTLTLLACLLLVGGVQAVTWTSANGCWTATDGAYSIVMWNATGTSSWTPPAGVSSVEYLVVGGGGGVNVAQNTGGGGAGGVRYNSSYTLSTSPVTIVVGAGGENVHDTRGGNSSFDSISATGGGAGGWGGGNPGYSGGSGGGAVVTATGAAGNAGGYSPVEGYKGGDSLGASVSPYLAGGGGGAGEAGHDGSGTVHGSGGDGVDYSSIFGTTVGDDGWFGGGGGAMAGLQGGTPGTGGKGGGADGASYPATGASGMANTGGGGSGGSSTGGHGGSGIVIIRYLIPAPVASFTSVNISVATNGTTIGWSGVAPFTVKFTNTTPGLQTSWVWNATNVTGNNVAYTFNTSTYSAPIYTFSAAGNYTIKLNATNSGGSNLSTQVTWVNVSSGTTTPIVQWITDKTVVVFPGRIFFNDTSLNTPTSWNWSFGDGSWFNSSDPSTGLNKSYQYVKRGRWIANLTVSNAAGTNTSASHSKSITVIGYQGFTPVMPDVCSYSTSRALNYLEKLMTDCKLCGVCG